MIFGDFDLIISKQFVELSCYSVFRYEMLYTFFVRMEDDNSFVSTDYSRREWKFLLNRIDNVNEMFNGLLQYAVEQKP